MTLKLRILLLGSLAAVWLTPLSSSIRMYNRAIRDLRIEVTAEAADDVTQQSIWIGTYVFCAALPGFLLLLPRLNRFLGIAVAMVSCLVAGRLISLHPERNIFLFLWKPWYYVVPITWTLALVLLGALVHCFLSRRSQHAAPPNAGGADAPPALVS
jgi:hypothetical protein